MSLKRCPVDPKHVVHSADCYCETCGAKLAAPPVCPKGHEVFNDNAKFCWSCGIALNSVDPVKAEVIGKVPQGRII